MFERLTLIGFGLLLMGCSVNGTSALKDAGDDNGNPFANTTMYVNPLYVAKVQSSIDRRPDLSWQISKIQYVSTAFWIDKIEAISKVRDLLEGARGQRNASGRDVSISFVIYDLPDRDCAAGSSAGELWGNDGLTRYESEYIDAIAGIFNSYRDLKIIAYVEPDSLANIATNLGNPKCTAAADNYKRGIAHAVSKLHEAGAILYLDGAHSGWLGWNDNRRKMADVVKEVLGMAGSTSYIRGLVTNLANYTPLDLPQAWLDVPWYDRSNPATGEITFARLMAQDFAAAGLDQIRFVIDTSRNGVIDSRRVWGDWCNIAGAGLGERPQVNPAPGIDAYAWIKTPGESDGASDSSSGRYNYSCSSQDSFLGAPEAGAWFHEYFVSLVQKATPGL